MDMTRTRPRFRPWVASGNVHPMITSSMRLGSRSPALFSRSPSTVQAMCSGRVSLSIPRGAFPTAVRQAATITASLMVDSSFFCNVLPLFLFPPIKTPAAAAESPLVPQRLAGLKHVLNPHLGLGIAAKAQECLTLQIQEVLLAHHGVRQDFAPRKGHALPWWKR